MITLNDLANELGISVHAVRRRLGILIRMADGQVSAKVMRGARGQLLIDASVAELLREAETRARESGISFAQSLEALLKEGANGDAHGAQPSRYPSDTNLAQAILKAGYVVGGSIFLGLALLAAVFFAKG